MNHLSVGKKNRAEMHVGQNLHVTNVQIQEIPFFQESILSQTSLTMSGENSQDNS